MDQRTRTGLLVGGLAMFFALDLAFLVSLAGFAFAPEAVGQALIGVLPGFIVVPLIGPTALYTRHLPITTNHALFVLYSYLRRKVPEVAITRPTRGIQSFFSALRSSRSINCFNRATSSFDGPGLPVNTAISSSGVRSTA